MATTFTVISRSELSEPDFQHDGGSLLHSRVTTLRSKLGDDSNSRYEEYTSIADNTIVEHKHNLGVNLNQISVYIYTGSGTNLVRVQDPLGEAVPWAINEKTGSEKTTIEVTTPNGGAPHTFAVVVVHNTQKDYGAANSHVAVTSNLTLRDKILYRVDTTTPRTLTLPAVSEQLWIPIKDITGTASANNITINTPGAEAIDGAASFVMSSDYEALIVISDGTNYFIL